MWNHRTLHLQSRHPPPQSLPPTPALAIVNRPAPAVTQTLQGEEKGPQKRAKVKRKPQERKRVMKPQRKQVPEKKALKRDKKRRNVIKREMTIDNPADQTRTPDILHIQEALGDDPFCCINTDFYYFGGGFTSCNTRFCKWGSNF